LAWYRGVFKYCYCEQPPEKWFGYDLQELAKTTRFSKRHRSIIRRRAGRPDFPFTGYGDG